MFVILSFGFLHFGITVLAIYDLICFERVFLFCVFLNVLINNNQIYVLIKYKSNIYT